MAQNMNLQIFLNVMFAGVIAFGVVYNSARVSLSDRAWRSGSGSIDWIWLACSRRGSSPMRRALLNLRVLAGVFAVAALLGVALWPRPTVVDVAVATRGPLLMTVEEEGVTRVRDRLGRESP